MPLEDVRRCSQPLVIADDRVAVHGAVDLGSSHSAQPTHARDRADHIPPVETACCTKDSMGSVRVRKNAHNRAAGGTLQTLLNAMSTLVDERERKTKRVSKAQNRIIIQNFIKFLLFIFGIPTNLG